MVGNGNLYASRGTKEDEYYTDSPIVYQQLSLFDVLDDEVKEERHPYKVEITEVTDENGDGAVDLSDVELLLLGEDGASLNAWYHGII